MRLPKKIKIAGFIYTVKRVDVIENITVEKGKNCAGSYSALEEEIEIQKGYGNIEPQILLHEVLHAIDFSYNNERLDEETIERLSQGLYDFLRNNKIEWVKE